MKVFYGVTPKTIKKLKKSIKRLGEPLLIVVDASKKNCTDSAMVKALSEVMEAARRELVFDLASPAKGYTDDPRVHECLAVRHAATKDDY